MFRATISSQVCRDFSVVFESPPPDFVITYQIDGFCCLEEVSGNDCCKFRFWQSVPECGL